jgi:transketolase
VSASGVFPKTVEELSATARQIRQDILRMSYRAGSDHAGSCLSVADLVTALVFHELRIDPEHPDWPDRDRLVLSKGHAAAALYSALAHRGFLDPAALPSLREVGTPVQGLVDRRAVPAVEALTGAPGVGVGMAVGMALDARLAKRPSRVYVIVGDGECRAGLTWEALTAAGQYALDNLVVLVDRNGKETDGEKEETSGLEPLADKLRAFRCDTLEIDGHDFPAILGALAHARTTKGRPTAIIARTVRGKGVSFIEDQPGWRVKVPTRDETERGLAELGGSL